MERTHFDRMEIEEFLVLTSPVPQSTGRNCTGLASTKLIFVSITLTQSSGENVNNRFEKKKKYSPLYSDNSSMHEWSSTDI
jgi:hypothetical protein